MGSLCRGCGQLAGSLTGEPRAVGEEALDEDDERTEASREKGFSVGIPEPLGKSEPLDVCCMFPLVRKFGSQ